MTDESFDENENDVQSKNYEQSSDNHKNENDDNSKENDEVNGDKYDQVKIEKIVRINFLFFPNYKYRKKKWPGKIYL